jgi:hypothetical protein
LRKLFLLAAVALAFTAWGQQKSTFQDIYVIDDTTLGSSSGDTLTINAATSFVGPLLFGDGTVGAPAVSFTLDTDIGMWRSAANTLNFSVAGAEVCEFGATANSIGNASDITTMLGGVRIGTGSTPGITHGNDDLFVEGTAEIDGVVSVSAGAVGAPSIYGTDDVNTGIWWSGADILNFSVAGAEVAEFGATASSIGNASDTTTLYGAWRVGTGATPDVTLGDDDFFVEGSAEVDGVLSVSAGAVGAPAIYSAADTNTGIWFSAADIINLSVAGVEVAEFGATANSLGNASDITTVLGGLRVGTGGTPGITHGDDDLYIEGTAEVDGVVSVSAGAVGAPAIYCTDDTNTGLYSSAADTVDVAVGGANVLSLGATANQMGNTSDTTTMLGFVRVGTGSAFGSAAGDDDLGVEDCLEVDGECRLDGIVDANSTSDFADTMVLSKGSGDALQVSAGGTVDLDGNLEVAGVMSYGVGTLGDTDLTPDVSSATIWKSQSNTGATAITDLDNPVTGAIYVFICDHANNPPSIADGGNFSLSANWTPNIDDSLTVFVRADNDYVELSRSAN